MSDILYDIFRCEMAKCIVYRTYRRYIDLHLNEIYLFVHPKRIV